MGACKYGTNNGQGSLIINFGQLLQYTGHVSRSAVRVFLKFDQLPRMFFSYCHITYYPNNEKEKWGYLNTVTCDHQVWGSILEVCYNVKTSYILGSNALTIWPHSVYQQKKSVVRGLYCSLAPRNLSL